MKAMDCRILYQHGIQWDLTAEPFWWIGGRGNLLMAWQGLGALINEHNWNLDLSERGIPMISFLHWRLCGLEITVHGVQPE